MQHSPAEYKLVRALFADVVHSMDIAAAVGAERLREMMADLADRCAAVVQRYEARWTSSPGRATQLVFYSSFMVERQRDLTATMSGQRAT